MNLQIRIQDTGDVVVNGIPARRLSVEVLSATGLSPKIFLARKQGDLSEFVTVCLAADLDNFPEDEPLEDAEDPLFRTDEIIFTTNVPDLVTQLRTDIDRRVKLLLASLKQIETYTSSTTLTYTA